MNQKQLECFVSVATHQNFTKAAEEMYLSQPGLSHQIKSLEKSLNSELFQRNAKNVSLTFSGELFLEDAKKILSLMEDAKKKLSLTNSQPLILRIIHLAAPTHHFYPM